jgi:hypothetical protein
MKLTADQIDSKAIAGKTEDGRPVVYVCTRGGLHAFFCKDEDGNTCSIGAAPHKAIAQFLANKKEKIKWEDDFKKSEEDLAKSEADLFMKLRKLMFMPSLTKGELPNADQNFIVYDTNKSTIEVVNAEDLEDDIHAGKVDRYALIRDMALSNPPVCAQDHEMFADLFSEAK